jgi:hypothetical protein
VQRAAALEATEQELTAERSRLEVEALALAHRRTLTGSDEQRSDEAGRELTAQTDDLIRRASELDERERQLAAREAKAAAVVQRDANEEARRLAALESSVRARESELTAREAELLRLQAGLAAQQESIRSRERALDDAERLQQREAALPPHPYVSFSEGLDAFTGGRARSG